MRVRKEIERLHPMQSKAAAYKRSQIACQSRDVARYVDHREGAKARDRRHQFRRAGSRWIEHHDLRLVARTQEKLRRVRRAHRDELRAAQPKTVRVARR